MTTDEALDLLDRLTDPDRAEQAEKLANRPFDRFPGRYFKADIPAQEIAPQSRRPANSQFDQWGFYLDLNITEVYEANPPLEPGNYQLWVRTANPKRQDGKDNDRTINTEAVQMAQKSGIRIRDLPGKKDVIFHEEMHDYESRRDTGEPDPKNPGRTLWKDVTQTTYYYKVTIGGAQSNGTAAPVAEVTPETIELALSIIREAGEAGIPEKDFSLACSKVQALKPLWSSVANGSFIKDQLKAKAVSTTAEGNLVTV